MDTLLRTKAYRWQLPRTEGENPKRFVFQKAELAGERAENSSRCGNA